MGAEAPPSQRGAPPHGFGFYHLTGNPFRSPLDGQSPLLTARHQSALDAVRAAIRTRQPIVLVTGNSGMGKTALIQRLLASDEDQGVTAVQIQPPSVSFAELVAIASRALGLAVRSDVRRYDTLDLLSRLAHALVRELEAGRRVVLVIDDVHGTPVETLGALHRLAALRTARGNLMPIVLVGHPSLREKLRSAPQLGREALHVSLSPLSRRETIAYLRERLAAATADAGDPQQVIAEKALRRIAKHAQGKPRMLNAIGRNSLATGRRKGERPISVETVEQVVESFRRVIAGTRDSGKHGHLRWAVACVAGLALLAGFGGVMRSSYQRLLGERHAASVPSAPPAPVPTPRESRPSPEPNPTRPAESAVSPRRDAAGNAERVRATDSARPTPPAESPPVVTERHRIADEATPVPGLATLSRGRSTKPSEAVSLPALPAITGRPSQSTETMRDGGTEWSFDSPVDHTGRISVMSYPRGLVFIDGRFVGSTPLPPIVVPVGPREVRVEANGRAQSTIALVKKGGNRAVAFEFPGAD